MDTLPDQARHPEPDATASPGAAPVQPAPAAHGPAWALVAGSELAGRYLVQRELGRGGMGRVYLARDHDLQREVAIKVVSSGPADAAEVRQLEREARVVASLRHPNILLVHDLGWDDCGPFLVEEYLEGESLRELLARERPGPSRVLELIDQAARGLAAAHARGVIHCDLKPDNLFVTRGGQLKILDFGIARLAAAVGAGSGGFTGTPRYASPEQLRGAALDARTDLYSLGVVWLELCGGQRSGGDRPPEPPRGLPRGLQRLLARCLATDPARRPHDGAALVAELERLHRRRGRARALGLSGMALGAAAAAALVARVFAPPAAPPGPLRIAVADEENRSGEPALDGLAELIARGLQPSARLQLVDRARLNGILRASGRTPPSRLDRSTAGFAARQAGAAALLIPSAAPADAGVRIGLEARDPESGRLLFSLEEQGARDRLLPVIERVAQRGREALLDSERELRTPDRELARAITASLEANRCYVEGLRCVERPSEGARAEAGACERHFRQALAIDPEFPLAHFELARLARWEAYTTEQLGAVLEPALRRIDRLPAREQAHLRAWEAELAGNLGRAAEVLRNASRDWPEDARLFLGLGELFYRQGRFVDAVAPLQRAVQLDPGLELAADMLVWSLGLLDRTAELATLADELAGAAPSPGTLRAEGHARGWTGDAEGALRVARRAAPGAGGAGGAGREDLEDALVAAERYAEAEGLLREDAAAGTERALARLAALLRLRGRAREAEAVAARRPVPAGPQQRFIEEARRAFRLAATRDAAGIRAIAEGARKESTELAATLAPVLAYAGALDEAEAGAAALDEGPGARALLAAVIAWRRQGPAAALPDLRRLARADPGGPGGSMPPEAPAWLAAECAAEVAPAEAALEDLRRFQRFYFPFGIWRTWAWPRGLALEARLLEGLDRRAEAREALARLESLWAGADPGQPLLAEARALRLRLGRTASTVVMAPDGRGPGKGGRR